MYIYSILYFKSAIIQVCLEQPSSHKQKCFLFLLLMFIQNSITVCLSADFQPFGKENHLSSFSLKMFSLSLTEADLKHQQSL